MQAQTTKNTIDLLSAPTTKNKGKSSKDEGGSDFLSMVLDAAANKAKSGETISEKDVKEIAKSVNMQAQQRQSAQSEAAAKVATELAEKLDETTKNELYENANFMQLLQVLEILNGGQISKYPNFSDKIANFLSMPENVSELANVKSVTDLLNLAKKFDLGLENISISSDDVENLGEMFKNLGSKEFFTPTAPQQLYTQELKSQVEQTINESKSPDEPVKLNQLLQAVAQKSAPQTQQTPQTTQQTQIAGEATESQLASDEAVQTPNLSTNLKENRTERPINLQSLLYPEREQAANEQNFAQNSESSTDSQNPLNAMVRDISRAASNQMQEKALVRETFSNFSENLKEQIANYKAPFTRVNLTLNPLNLGEVEITMVTRGNNLHINFNSTTTAMNLFLQNQAEFKNSLVNMGFTELEMNFSDQSQKQEHGREAYKNAQHRYADEQATDEMEQNLLEIVIPRYI